MDECTPTKVRPAYDRHEDDIVHLAASEITAQMLKEGITVDDSLRNEFFAQIREHVLILIETPQEAPFCKKELAKEALELSDVTSLKLKARKVDENL